MAYRFKLGESFGKGLRRIGTDEIERARARLAHAAPVTAVHETRKTTKRLRALLRLVRSGLSEPAFAEGNAGLRDVARLLSASRDSVVLNAVIDRLAAEADANQPALTRLREGIATALPDRALDAHAVDTQAVDRGAPTHQARARLHEAGIGWRKLRLGSESFEPISTGLADGMRRLRLTFEAASADDDETYHEWRKAVQLHWRHMRLVQAGWPVYFEARATEAKAISELLGAGQDLTLLLAHVNGEAGERLTRKQARALTALAEARRDSLRAAAHERCARLVAEGADGFARRAAVYWAASVQLQQRAVDAGPGDGESRVFGEDDPAAADPAREPESTPPAEVLALASSAWPARAVVGRRKAGGRCTVPRGPGERPSRSKR